MLQHVVLLNNLQSKLNGYCVNALIASFELIVIVTNCDNELINK